MISKEKKTEVIKEYGRFEGDTGSPEVQIAILTARIKELALEKDLLLLTCGSDHNVVRFIAPITVTSAEIDKCIKILDEVLEEIC